MKNIAFIGARADDSHLTTQISGGVIVNCNSHNNFLETNKPILKVTNTLIIELNESVPYEYLRLYQMATHSIIIVSKLDKSLIANKFNLPLVSIPLSEEDLETIAENDEELLEKYCDGQDISSEASELLPSLLKSGSIGLIVDTFQDALEHAQEDDTKLETDFGVFATIIDPYKGQLSYIKAGKDITSGSLFTFDKNTLKKTDIIKAGELGVIAKNQDLRTGDGLDIEFSSPMIEYAVEAPGLEEKLVPAIQQMIIEDPTIRFSRNKTGQMILGGMGQVHLDLFKLNLQDKIGGDVTLIEPDVEYKYTITTSADIEAKHKKQSGGSGQFAIANIKFDPTEEEFEFVDEIKGGAIDKKYIPSVEKGLREFLDKESIVNVKATLYFGKMHSVDSSDMAFYIAGGIAGKELKEAVKLVKLEPIKEVEITAPEEFVGNIMSDLGSRRAQIQGIDGQIVRALVPYKELLTYGNTLTGLTQGQGFYTSKDSGYSPATE